MKIRIHQNNIRLRLSPADLEKVRLGNEIVSTTSFSPADRLSFILRPHTLDSSNVSFRSNEIIVIIPEKELIRWAASDEISMEFSQGNADGSAVNLLIEKDFDKRQ